MIAAGGFLVALLVSAYQTLTAGVSHSLVFLFLGQLLIQPSPASAYPRILSGKAASTSCTSFPRHDDSSGPPFADRAQIVYGISPSTNSH